MTEHTVSHYPSPFRLRTLGDLVLDQRGERIGEARRKPLAVLAYVAVASAHAPPVNREGLAALLWADSAPEKARRTLAQTLYALRKECGADLLVGHSQLETVPALLAVDAVEFRDAVRRGDHERALALYGGPFLDGVHFPGAVEFDQWVEKTRAQFAAAHREVLLASARALFVAGETIRALARLEQAHLEYPDDVMVVEALATAYLANDAPHRALAAIDRFERHLREEYDVALPTSVQRLRERSRGSLSAFIPEESADAIPRIGTSPFETPALEAAARATPSREEAPRRSSPVKPPPVAPSRRRRSWRLITGAMVFVAFVLAGGVWYARHVLSQPSTIAEARRLEHVAQRNARFGPFDSSTIGRVAILPPVNRTGNPEHDARLARLRSLTHAMVGRTFIGAVPMAVVDTLTAELRLDNRTPATPHQAVELFERTGAALVIQPQIFTLGDSIRVHFTLSRNTAHTPRAVPGGVNVEQYENGYLDGVDIGVYAAAFAAEESLREFLTSLDSCVRPDLPSPPSAPWCWTSGRHLAMATGKPSRLRTWWWELRTVLYLDRTPETAFDQLRREQALAHAARRRAIDSSHMGRTVLLPARNNTGNPALDSLTFHLDYRLQNILRSSFARAVPASYSTPIFEAQRNTRLPTTTTMQVAAVLQATGAGLAIQPFISRTNDGLVRVHFVFYRDLSHTSLAVSGSPNLETLSTPATSGVAADGTTAIGLAERRMLQFVRSLEVCTAAAHTDEAAAPWCWGVGRRLQVADAVPRLRRTGQLSAR